MPLPLPDIIHEIERRIGEWFAPAGDRAREILRRMQLPPEIADFYASFEPSDVTIFGVCHFSVASMWTENFDRAPGRLISHLGFVVFAGSETSLYAYDVAAGGQQIPVVVIPRNMRFEAARSRDFARGLRRYESHRHYWREVLEELIEAERAGWFRVAR